MSLNLVLYSFRLASYASIRGRMFLRWVGCNTLYSACTSSTYVALDIDLWGR